MRNVARKTKPKSLQQNALSWKKELLNKIAVCKRKKEKVPYSFYDKYNQDDVKETLKEMYNGLCCYCESQVGVVEFGHIEHRMPKRKFPKQTYDWNNLHLSCTYCNTHKGQKYSKQNPILDAVNDVIVKHLSYEVDQYGMWRSDLTKQGETTIMDTDLNREKLRKERLLFYCDAMGLIHKIRQKGDCVETRKALAELDELQEGVYGSIISHLKQLGLW